MKPVAKDELYIVKKHVVHNLKYARDAIIEENPELALVTLKNIKVLIKVLIKETVKKTK